MESIQSPSREACEASEGRALTARPRPDWIPGRQIQLNFSLTLESAFDTDKFVTLSSDSIVSSQDQFDSRVYARWIPPECGFFFDVKRIA